MADNTELPSGSGGDTIATDDIGGVKFQRVKLIHGADGVNAGDVADANPLPVDDAGGSLTVDNAALSVTGGGVEASALRVTLASDSTGVVSVDDNGATLSVDDGGGALTVDSGQLPAALAAGGGLKVEGVAGGVAVPVSAATLPLPSGASTSANQDTANTALAAIQTAAEILDNAISGTEMQVDVVAALPAGTNAIGKLAANSGVDIGDVDVLSVVPGTGATNLGKAVDAVAGATDTGVPTLAVRDDALTTLTPADGDYVPLRVNSTGALHVTGGGGGTEYAVDDALGTTPTGSVVLAARDDALSTLTPVEGDAVPLRTDANGALWVKNSGTVTVDGSAVTQPVSAASLPLPTGAATAANQSTGNTALSGIQTAVELIDNAISGTEMQVDVVAPLPAGTNAIGKLAANSGVDIGDVDVLSLPNVTLAAGTNTNEVVGDAAHDAAIAGNPVRVAGRALSADYTAVAAGDTADLITDLIGRLVVLPHALPANHVKGSTSDITGTTSTSVVAAAGAGLKNYITHILIQNSHATVGTWVLIQDGSGGTTIYQGYAAAAGGGVSITLPVPIATTANTALFCACVTTGANVRVSASGYKAP